MQLAEAKGCWLSDLRGVPAEERMLWIAFYKLEEIKRRREQRRAEAKSGR